MDLVSPAWRFGVRAAEPRRHSPLVWMSQPRPWSVAPGRWTLAAAYTERVDALIAGSPLLRRIVSRSAWVHIVAVDHDGVILHANAAMAASREVPAAALVGQPLPSLLTHDGESWAARCADAARTGEPFLLNFLDSQDAPFTLVCDAEPQDGGWLIVGEPHREAEQRLHRELLDLNNQLAVLTRENVRQRKQVEQTLEQLQASHWQLKKISEVLPVCLRCHKVKGEGAQWQTLLDFLVANSQFLSHGYCPACTEAVMKEWNL